MTAQLVSITSGKGGTGKSLLTVNLGVYLASLGKKVILVDASIGSSSLHSFLGAEDDHRGLGSFWNDDSLRLDDLVKGTQVEGLKLISGGGDLSRLSEPQKIETLVLLDKLRSLEADYVICDLSTGSRRSTLELWLGAEKQIVVANANPASIESTYKLIKTAFFYKLKNIGLGHWLDERRLTMGAGKLIPGDFITRIFQENERDDIGLLKKMMASLRPMWVMNMMRSKLDDDLGPAVSFAAGHRLGIPMSELGSIPHDDAAWTSLRRRWPLFLEHPEARASKAIARVAKQLMAVKPKTDFKPLAHRHLYELFQVSPMASDEAIRRGYRQMKDVYSSESMVMSGLYNAEELSAFRKELDDAYDTLSDSFKRRKYDEIHLPADYSRTHLKSEPVYTPIADEALPPMPEVTEKTEIVGDTLKHVRMAKGLKLREVADRTKIGLGYLKAIEDEDYKKLPAPVYLRGFIKEFSKCLGLNPEWVLRSYMRKVEENPVEPTLDE